MDQRGSVRSFGLVNSLIILTPLAVHAFDCWLPHSFHCHSYVAVTGLPQPRKDHAIAMCRFARDILKRMRPLCKRLTRTLGPDTCELRIRIGLNSGPVTGGILRGERRRFQLFGDTGEFWLGEPNELLNASVSFLMRVSSSRVNK